MDNHSSAIPAPEEPGTAAVGIARDADRLNRLKEILFFVPDGDLRSLEEMIKKPFNRKQRAQYFARELSRRDYLFIDVARFCGWKLPDSEPKNLRYEIAVYDDRDNVVCLDRQRDLDRASAAFQICCAKYPAKRIFLRDRARVIRSSERPEG